MGLFDCTFLKCFIQILRFGIQGIEMLWGVGQKGKEKVLCWGLHAEGERCRHNYDNI
jgi:hypothetical protein